jgi:hypothetical protein
MPMKMKSAARNARGGDVTSKERECDWEFGVSLRNGIKGGNTHHAHGFSYYEDHGLVGDDIGAREEEVGEG